MTHIVLYYNFRGFQDHLENILRIVFLTFNPDDLLNQKLRTEHYIVNIFKTALLSIFPVVSTSP